VRAVTAAAPASNPGSGHKTRRRIGRIGRAKDPRTETMKRLAYFLCMGMTGAVLGALGSVDLAGLSGPSAVREADAAKACVQRKFATKLIGKACKKGGQKEADRVMKQFLVKMKAQDPDATCNTCHASLAPTYELTLAGLRLFRNYGGN
jgi:hypothetical protein